jgi:DNA-binding NarL/FixJ family response regulator
MRCVLDESSVHHMTAYDPQTLRRMGETVSPHHFAQSTQGRTIRMTATRMALENGAYRPKLLFVDDHHLVLDALKFMAAPHYEVQAVDTLQAFDHAIDAFDPDLAILDVRMPDGDGFEVARRALARKPLLKIMFLSMHAEQKFAKLAAEIGAHGYLSKRAPADEVLTAIRTVLNGGKYIGSRVRTELPEPGVPGLTDRQIEVLRLISQGLSAKEIATRLDISVRTAEFHRAAIMERLKLHSTAMMTRYALEHGIV